MEADKLRHQYEKGMSISIYTRARYIVVRNVLNDIQHYSNAFRLTPGERAKLQRVQTQLNRMLELDAKHRMVLKNWHEEALPYRRCVDIIMRYLYGKA